MKLFQSWTDRALGFWSPWVYVMWGASGRGGEADLPSIPSHTSVTAARPSLLDFQPAIIVTSSALVQVSEVREFWERGSDGFTNCAQPQASLNRRGARWPPPLGLLDAVLASGALHRSVPFSCPSPRGWRSLARCWLRGCSRRCPPLPRGFMLPADPDLLGLRPRKWGPLGRAVQLVHSSLPDRGCQIRKQSSPCPRVNWPTRASRKLGGIWQRCDCCPSVCAVLTGSSPRTHGGFLVHGRSLCVSVKVLETGVP